MTTLLFVEGNPSEYNLLDDYASEYYDSEVYFNWTEAAPYSNLFESVYYDVLQDVLIDVEYVPAHAAPTIEAENAIEQSVVIEAVEADATLETETAVEEEEDRFVEGSPSEYNLLEDYASEDYASEVYSNWTEAAPYSNLFGSVYYDVLQDVLIDVYVPAHAAPTIEAEYAIEDSVVLEAVEADATLESEIAVEEGEDSMSEWYEEEYEDMINEGTEEAYEDEAWVAGEEGLTIQDFAESNVPFEEETWIGGEDATIEDSVCTIGSILPF